MKHKARITIKVKGGPGSGNYGHRGRPGKLGGSTGGTRGIMGTYIDRPGAMAPPKSDPRRPKKRQYTKMPVGDSSISIDKGDLIVDNYEDTDDGYAVTMDMVMPGSYGKAAATKAAKKLARKLQKVDGVANVSPVLHDSDNDKAHIEVIDDDGIVTDFYINY